MKSQPSYLTFIDGLRAIAVLSVIIYHLDPGLLPGGFVGVDIFFVISGFVVSRSVSGARGTSFPSFLLYFYARRLVRIVPALAVCLLVSTIVTVFFIPYAWLSGTSQRTGLAAFFGFSNFVLAATAGDYFSPRADFNTFTHTWSLGVEEQYYLVFPYIFTIWLSGRKRLSTAILALVSIVSFIISIRATEVQPDRAFFLIYYRFWELGAGALLFQVMGDRPITVGGGIGSVLSLVGIAVALITASPHSTPFPGAILPVLSTLGVLLFFNALPASGWLLRQFTHPVPVFIGRISYSLYLWHWPVFVLFRWTVGLETVPYMFAALTIVVAASVISYRWVETPPRRARLFSRLPRIATVGIGLAVAVVGWAASSGIWALRPAISFSVVNRNPGDWYSGSIATSAGTCRLLTKSYHITNGAAQDISRSGCGSPVTVARHLFVIGDSHAGAYETMLKQTVIDTGISVDILSAGGCGMLTLLYPESPNCERFQSAAIASVLGSAVPGDIIFLPALRLPRIADEFVLFDEAAALAEVSSPATASLRAKQEADFNALLGTLVARRAIVVLEAPMPVFRSPAFRCSDWFNQSNPICARGMTIARTTIDTMREPVLQVFDRLKKTAPNLYVWDPLPTLCPHSTCSAALDGRPLFFDADHLSGFGNRILAPSFEHFLASLPMASPP